ncbi:hypothetical protein KUL42_04310 [Alteromonas sp. KUL42]|nr:hypothetical protein KUL42_04310 [Alteromonas sp. KUL42]
MTRSSFVHSNKLITERYQKNIYLFLASNDSGLSIRIYKVKDVNKVAMNIGIQSQ